jgi:lipopolysaccharide/colanic/teichoic acid biosynthesis glycosyltransferase
MAGIFFSGPGRKESFMMSKTWERVAKRLFDLSLAGVLLIVLAPMLIGVAAVVRISSGAPVLFFQSRSGLRGRPFRVVKFRTMTTDTVARVGCETRADDPHITKVGRWLRATGIDELPQLFNVLAGQMSIVGPRPLLAWENEQCDARQAKRLLVRPGLTGLAQVNGRNSIPWDERIEWDVRYVERGSFWMDLAICARTIPVALLGQNAYFGAKAAAAAPVSAAVVPVEVREAPVNC